MKRWLSYIVMAVLCGLYLSSCAKDEEVAKATDDGDVRVRLTLSLPGSTSRAINSPTEDGELDYTTKNQSKIEDVYVLVIGSNNKLKYLIKDLTVTNIPDNYNQKVLQGTMLRTIDGEQVRLVVLANLRQNQLTNVTNVQEYLERMVGQSITDIYNALVYNYTGPTPWEITSRGIPMWGISPQTAVPSTGADLECALYRAVAKVSLWVNQKKGYQHTAGDFTITGITVRNANDKGYCVSQATLNPVETIQYEAPYVGSLTMTPQHFEYKNLTETAAYEDMIYLPEQLNSDASAVTLEVSYTYGGQSKTGTIEFKKNGTGERMDIVRNHVYVFNIQIKEEVDAKLYYTVEDFTEKTINIPAFE